MTALLPPTDGLAELMMRARNILGHSQIEASTCIGISRRTWQRIERGEERSRTPPNVAAINAYLRRAGFEDLAS